MLRSLGLLVVLVAPISQATKPSQNLELNQVCRIGPDAECLVVVLETLDDPPQLPAVGTALKFVTADAVPRPSRPAGKEYVYVPGCSPRSGHYLAVLRSDKKVHSRVMQVLNDPARKPFELALDEPLMSPVCQMFPFNDIKENRCPQTTPCTGSLAAKGTRFLAVVARRKVAAEWSPWALGGSTWTHRWMAAGRQLDRFQLADNARIAQLEEYFKPPK